MLISHRQSAYVDNDELERAAGMLEIEAQSRGGAGAALAKGAALALRVLQGYDLKTAEDLRTVILRYMEDEEVEVHQWRA